MKKILFLLAALAYAGLGSAQSICLLYTSDAADD